MSECFTLESIVSYSKLWGLTSLDRAGHLKAEVPIPWNNIPKLFIMVRIFIIFLLFSFLNVLLLSNWDWDGDDQE